MRVAYFHTGTILSSWSIYSMASTLRSMGHEVFEGTIPTNHHGAVLQNVGRTDYERILATMPTIEDLESCDVILVAGPEYVAIWLNTLYGKDKWCKLKARRVGLYLESTKRQDAQFRYDIFADWYDMHYFPDLEDVARLGGQYLKGFIDIDMFKPCTLEGQPGHTCDDACHTRCLAEKKYKAAFVGSLYKKRMDFLFRLLPLIPDVDFRANGVTVRDLGGECHREWTELLVKNIRQIKVHVALPSNNMKMMVARPFETMACGTFLLTYNTEDNPFRDGVHCRVYDPEKPQELAELIQYYVAHEDEREAIARAGCEEVRKNFSIRDRLTEILNTAVAGRSARAESAPKAGGAAAGTSGI